MGTTVVRTEALAELSISILVATGIPRHQAVVVSEHMSWSDTHGRENYGVWRLPILCRRAESGLFETEAEPELSHRTEAVAVLDGKNAIGHYVATLATDAAAEKAARAGLAMVAVHRSNFMGALGYYADRMARRGFVGVVFGNAHPRVAAHGGFEPVLGTNPLAFSAPLPDGTTLLVDMATSAGAGSLITKSVELGRPLPEGIAVNGDGTPITDASKVGQGAMLPMAGPKGYGLALMVEVLAGVLTGAGVSHGVHSMYKDFTNPGDSGHMMLAMDISTLLERADFDRRMDSLASAVTGSGEVRLPGSNRWMAEEAVRRRGGVALDRPTVEALEELADRYDLTVPWAAADEETV